VTEYQATSSLEVLVDAMAHSDRHAFMLFYDRVAPAVVGLARTVVRNHAESEAVTVETFVELWRTASSYHPSRGGPIAWAMTVAHRRAVERVRGTRRRERAPHRRPDDLDGVDPERDLVRKGLEALGEPTRQTVLSAYYGARTYHELAATLAVEPATVRHRLRDGLRRLGMSFAPTD
jgi:RNA polymerase sigma-70 factor (ECF subfamily)